MVLNYLGSAYKRMGKLGKAKSYLESAITLVDMHPKMKYTGVTYMNICAVLSAMNDHE